MKITKEMGKACLRELKAGEWSYDSIRATRELDDCAAFHWRGKHLQTALAMCAAIAGVRPEDVE